MPSTTPKATHRSEDIIVILILTIVGAAAGVASFTHVPNQLAARMSITPTVAGHLLAALDEPTSATPGHINGSPRLGDAR
jgi:uncharacterized membrane protein